MKLWILWLSLFAVACTPSTPQQADSGPTPVVIVTADAGEPELPVSYERPVDPRTPTQKAIAACQDANGKWLCKNYKRPATVLAASNTQPITPTSWTVGDWYINPANNAAGGGDTCASDGNTCTSATCVGGCTGSTCPSGQGACLTFGEVIQHRLGTFFPRLQQITVFHKLSAQTLGQDLVFFEPFLGAGGQAKLIDSLIPWDGGATATLTDAGFKAKQYDAGQLLQVSGLPSGITAGLFVCDVTQGFSCAFIDSVLDAGVALMEQPLSDASFNMPTTGLPAAAEVNSWTPGDSVNVYAESALNLKSWNPVAGDVNDAGVFSGGWVQFSNISELGTGSNQSALPLLARGENGIAGCKVDPRVHISGIHGRGNPPSVFGNFHTGSVLTIASINGQLFGGGYKNGISIGYGTTARIGGDAIAHSSVVVQGEMTQCSFYTDGLFSTIAGVSACSTSASLPIWGPGTTAVSEGGQLQYIVGWPNYFLSGVMNIESSGTTGCVMTGLDAGTVTCNIPINTTNLAAQHTLKSFNTNSAYTDVPPGGSD